MTSRQSEPVLRRDVFPPSSPLERHSVQGPSHFDFSSGRPSQDFARHNESTFSNEGFLPSLQEADRFFGNGFPHDDYSIMSSDSRLSFGMRQQPAPPHAQQQQQQQMQPSGHFQDPIYETLSSYKHDPSAQRWSSNISTVSAPNLGSTSGMASSLGGLGSSTGRLRRGDPPPLPPKPRLLNMKQESIFGQNSNSHSLSQQQQQSLSSEIGLTRTDERGYSVSFV